eukprot:scaffold433_cov257-Pinguiococcus_pyrenoidosus.AAC.27
MQVFGSDIRGNAARTLRDTSEDHPRHCLSCSVLSINFFRSCSRFGGKRKAVTLANSLCIHRTAVPAGRGSFLGRASDGPPTGFPFARGSRAAPRLPWPLASRALRELFLPRLGPVMLLRFAEISSSCLAATSMLRQTEDSRPLASTRRETSESCCRRNEPNFRARTRLLWWSVEAQLSAACEKSLVFRLVPE